ncbi:HupE/UreJ family protein [Methyloferula stellata]|uniref:HupE/UreJ family protein n=1 Tax=Methyloferula stellata TaxID=876270 RepID=UPI0003709736|nr:HupE/UreJ family protein [Methyloferula stellata]
MRRIETIGLAAAGSLFAASSASAHFQGLGLSDFNAGVIHPLLTLQHALALIAFGLMCGQHGASLLRYGLPALTLGLGLGFAGAYLGETLPAAPTILTVLGLAAGLAVAANYRLPAWAAMGLGGMIGLMIGLESKPETATLLAQLAGISGTTIAVLLLFLNLAGLAAFVTAQWLQIGVRILGSWTSAAAFLNIMLLFRK